MDDNFLESWGSFVSCECPMPTQNSTIGKVSQVLWGQGEGMFISQKYFQFQAIDNVIYSW